jgi:catechol 2,3-dioxygenase-like lactoylglutathione lyase family enzyme
MEVRNLRWIGIQTQHYDAMVRLFRDVMGLGLAFEESSTIEFATTEGDAVQVMGPGDPYFDFFEEHANGPVPLFEVEDVGQARSELEAAGIEIVGDAASDGRWEWIHFRGPDGNLYELASQLHAPI